MFPKSQSTVEEISSFSDDLDRVNLSEVLDESDLFSEWDCSLTKHQSSSLSRYLVLEKVPQMSFILEKCGNSVLYN